MTAVTLTPEQRKAIREHAKAFRAYQETSEGRALSQERREHTEFFHSLDRQDLERMDEALLREIFGRLWASGFWGNKEYPVQRILANGLGNLQRAFVRLFDDRTPVSQRYDRFLKAIKGLGPASVTEMLSYRSPQSCGIWNDPARKSLDLLGFGEVLPLGKYRLSPSDLDRVNMILDAVGDELRQAGLELTDLHGVDFFLWVVWRNRGKEVEGPLSRDSASDWDHDEVRDKLAEIGAWLGFSTETEKPISYGARVDVTWRASIGNLGVVTYVFEVQKGGSIDSLILNLEKAKGNATVQKVVAVSDAKQLERIREEG